MGNGNVVTVLQTGAASSAVVAALL